MKRRNTLPMYILAFVLSSLLLVGCGVDCSWFGEGQAWIDENENGIWDAGESPLPGVSMSVQDLRNDVDGEGGETGADGKVNLSLFIPGCMRVTIEVSATAPSGYRSTTEEEVRVGRSDDEIEIVRFGFVPVEE